MNHLYLLAAGIWASLVILNIVTGNYYVAFLSGLLAVKDVQLSLG